jgi:hypothetical protein
VVRGTERSYFGVERFLEIFYWSDNAKGIVGLANELIRTLLLLLFLALLRLGGFRLSVAFLQNRSNFVLINELTKLFV